MFIKELWIFNKKLALFFCLFLLLWFFINYKKGAVAAPLFQYGMFGGKFSVKDTQTLVQLYVNGNRLELTKYSVVERDMIQIFLENYMTQQTTNLAFFRSMKRVLGKVAVGRWMEEKNFSNNITDIEFTQWYKRLLEKITGEKIIKLEAFRQRYLWQDGQLQPISEASKIDCIVAD